MTMYAYDRTANLDSLYDKVERAIKQHGKFAQMPGLIGEPEFRISRTGVTVSVRVRLTGSRKRDSLIKGMGDSPEEAVEKLIRDLDLWVEVW